MAERAGFEPAVLSHTAFRERHHQPLGHLSAGADTKGLIRRPWSDRPWRLPQQRSGACLNRASAERRAGASVATSLLRLSATAKKARGPPPGIPRLSGGIKEAG